MRKEKMQEEREKGEEIKGINKTMIEILALMWLWGVICGIIIGYFIY